MSVNSDKAIDKILKIEGGFVNNPNDKGKATNHGITKKVYEAYIGRTVTIEEMKVMPESQARDIYKKNYWDTIGGDYINNYSIAYCLFDQAVNRGPSSAIWQACAVAGIPKTGGINSYVLSSINKVDPMTFVNEYLIKSMEFYANLVYKDPSQEVFLVGWFNRVEKMRTYAEANLGKALAIAKETLEDNPWIYAIPILAISGLVIYYQVNKSTSRSLRPRGA